MTPPSPIPLSIEDLAKLYHGLNARVERLDGNVRQLLAERTRDALPRPTWRDMHDLRTDIKQLQQKLDALRP